MSIESQVEPSDSPLPSSQEVSIQALVDEHYRLIYRYAFRLTGSASDAEDLTQHTFLVAQQKLGQLHCRTQARAWLCAIVRHHYFRVSRRAKWGQPLHERFDLVDPLSEPEEWAFPVDLEQLPNALAALSEAYRSTLILYYFEQFSYAEIAVAMEVPLGTVMSRLARARLQLREELLRRSHTTDRMPTALQRDAIPRVQRLKVSSPLTGPLGVSGRLS